MTPNEADIYYGKELASEIWSNFDLTNLKVESTPEGLDIPSYEWESVKLSLEFI